MHHPAGEICDIYQGRACERCVAGYYLERDTKQCRQVGRVLAWFGQ